MNTSNIGFFGTGTSDGGGTGIEKILERIEDGYVNANVKVLVINHSNGGVSKLVETFKYIVSDLIVIEDFPKREIDGNFSDENFKKIKSLYEDIIDKYNLNYVFLSGWMKYVYGLIPNKTINIYPGPMVGVFGGKGMYGDNIHKKIWDEYEKGNISKTCITMGFVTEKIDDPSFTIVQVPVEINGGFNLGNFSQNDSCKTWEEIKKRVNVAEHYIQWKITDLVIKGAISWDGDFDSKVIFDMEKIGEYDFPEGTVFGGEVDLK